MVEKENERCFVCVEDQVARETRVLLLFDRNLSNFEGVGIATSRAIHFGWLSVLCRAFLIAFTIKHLLQVE